jgi:hypothetical protein
MISILITKNTYKWVLRAVSFMRYFAIQLKTESVQKLFNFHYRACFVGADCLRKNSGNISLQPIVSGKILSDGCLYRYLTTINQSGAETHYEVTLL